METFVVHIHRRPETRSAAELLAGVVERTDTAVSRPFGTVGELLALLGVVRAPGGIAPVRPCNHD